MAPICKALLHASLALVTWTSVFALHSCLVGSRQVDDATPGANALDDRTQSNIAAVEAGALTADEIRLREALLVSSTDACRLVDAVAELYSNYCCQIGEREAVIRIQGYLRRNRHVAKSKVANSSAQLEMKDGSACVFMLYTCRPPCANPLP